MKRGRNDFQHSSYTISVDWVIPSRLLSGIACFRFTQRCKIKLFPFIRIPFLLRGLILKVIAQSYIAEASLQMSLFEEEDPSDGAITLRQCKYLGVHYTFFYEVLQVLQIQIGYNHQVDELLNDLVIMRIIEPVSKLRSIELMNTYFSIRHRPQQYYESALAWLELKGKVEKQTLQFVKEQYHFDFSLLFYDVTTLYFETFESDGLHKPGFSKDGKSQ